MTTSRGGRFYLILAGLAWTANASAVGDAQGASRSIATPSAAPAPSALDVRGDADASTAAGEHDAQPVRRIVRLTDGRVLRGRAVSTATGWRCEIGEQWVDIPAALVRDVQGEREAQAELETRKHATKPSDTRARVALAEWMLDHAFVKESVRELDRVLGLDPDQPEALALLRAHPIAVAEVVPANESSATTHVEAILASAALAAPALRECAVEKLRAENSGDVRSRLTRDLVSSDARRRSFSTLAWRRLFPGEQVAALQERALLDTQSDVRSGAARALRDARQPEVTARVVQNLEHPAGIVRVHAMQALGTMGYGMAVGPLVASLERLAAPGGASDGRPPGSNIFVGTQTAFVQDFDVEVAQNAAIAKPVVNVLTEGSVLDARILSVQSVSVGDERAAACAALEALTNAHLGKKPAAWIAWWKDSAARARDGESRKVEPRGSERTNEQGAPRLGSGASSQ